MAQRCEKIWWLGPYRCRAGSQPEANKSPLRHHAAPIEMLVEMRMASLYAKCVCSGAGASSYLKVQLVPTFGKPCVSKGGGVLKLILVHHVSPRIRHGVEFRGIPVDTCRHSSE